METLGTRIRHARGKLITQAGLAELTGVSTSFIKKVEGGTKMPSTPVLQKIARALDVSIDDLVGNRPAFPTGDLDAGIIALRRALTPIDDLTSDAEAASLSLAEAQREVDKAWGAYWFGRFEKLTGDLPAGISTLRATARRTEKPRAHELYADMLYLAACTLVHLGQPDPAWIAIRTALEEARKGDDPLLEATVRGSIGWQLLVQGRYRESQDVVLKAAEDTEPRGDVSDQHLSVHGGLLLQGAVAAGRGQRVREALALAGEAERWAERLGRETKYYETNFGPSQIVMQTVDIHVSSEQYVEAMTAAKRMPKGGLDMTTISQGRHLIDKAAAAANLGQHETALHMLLTAERIGGEEWVKYQTLLRNVLGVLLHHDRHNKLRAFAQRVGVLGSSAL
ncbi:helix-turn-helix domain-containing protein [Nocardia sp. NPDC003482]